jgi:hypothetical protein
VGAVASRPVRCPTGRQRDAYATPASFASGWRALARQQERELVRDTQEIVGDTCPCQGERFRVEEMVRRRAPPQIASTSALPSILRGARRSERQARLFVSAEVHLRDRNLVARSQEAGRPVDSPPSSWTPKIAPECGRSVPRWHGSEGRSPRSSRRRRCVSARSAIAQCGRS